ncbi:MAG: hypothetical protein HYT62_04595 [Candidatus Yanofskybacteria bacterium]|nr:hypothetical protein [Candidatus Yanofskybacteria bacterium]
MSNSENITIKTTGIVNLFLKDHFKHSPQNKLFNIGYTQKDKTLLIEAGNKILANELSLRLTDLYDQFKKEGIQLAKILIR